MLQSHTVSTHIHLHRHKPLRMQRRQPSPAVPVLPATLLALELLLQEPCIDLTRISALVLSDPGATLHTLRLAGCGDAPHRLEECVASLDAESWFHALSEHALPCSESSREIVALWQHAQAIASCARFAAEATDSISAETAYLVGLFHAIDTTPSLRGTHEHLKALLPSFLCEALAEAKNDAESIWNFILSSAHLLSRAAEPLILRSSCSTPLWNR